MREDIGKQDYAKNLLDQLQQKAPQSTGGNAVAPNINNQSGTNTDGNTTQAVGEDDPVASLLVSLSLDKVIR